MEEKFCIDDVEYTIHTGPYPEGDRALSPSLSSVNEQYIRAWMQHHEAKIALRSAANRIKPINGATDATIARLLADEAANHRLTVARRTIEPKKKEMTANLLSPDPDPQPRWQDGARPLGPGCWELDKLNNTPQAKEDKRHKLALEIAGAHKVSLQGELIAESDSGTIARYNLTRGGVHDDHRRQVFIENLAPGGYNLHLKLPDNRYGRYAIPLSIGRCKLPTCPKPTSRDPWPTVLVPIVPRTYTTIHLKRDKDHCDYPPDGWIYLFVDGKLWREVQVRDKGWFADVNLTMEKGKDIRKATVKADRTLLAPFQVEGYQPAIDICYAQIQWSWAQIEALGGMADDDTRLQKGPAIDPVAAGQFPFTRLQPVDLSGYPDFEQRPGCVGDSSQKGEDITCLRPDLAAFRQTRLPVVYLHNALGIAESLSAQYNEKLTELRRIVAELPTLKDVDNLDPVVAGKYADQKRAYYAAATTAYRLFFDPETTDNDGNPPRIIRNCKAATDRQTLENILQVKKRRKRRVKMIMIRKKLVSWLNGKIRSRSRNTAIEASHPDFVDTMSMLADYANLNGETYGLLWTKTAGVIGFLNHVTGQEDQGLDIASGWEVRTRSKRPYKKGVEYLKSMLKADHRLHTALFPTRQQVDEFKQHYLAPAQPEPADGSAIFRKGAFAAIKKAYPRTVDKDAKDAIKFIKQACSDFLLCFELLWSSSAETKTETNCLVRLAKAADDPELSGLHLSTSGNVKDLAARGLVPMGAGTARYHQIINAMHGENLPDRAKPTGKTMPIASPKTGTIIGQAAADGKGPAGFKPPPPAVSPKNWEALWNTNEKSNLVVSKDSGYAKKFFDTAKTSAQTAKRVLPPLVAVLELINFSRAASSFGKQFKNRKIDYEASLILFVSTFGVAYYTLDAFKAIVGETTLRQILNSTNIEIGDMLFKKSLKMAGGRVIVFRAWSAGLSSITGLISFYKMTECIGRNDYDAATAFGMAGVAYLGLSMAKIGAAQAASAIAMGIPLSEAGALAFLGPWGWAFLIVGIGTIFTAAMLTDTELENWAKHGPFALDHSRRWSENYSHRNLRHAYALLLGELMRPQITIRHAGPKDICDRTDIIAEVIAPGLDKSRSKIIVHATVQKVGRAVGEVPYSGPEEPKDYKQHFIVYHRVEEIRQDGVVTGLRYYYKGLSEAHNLYRWRTRTRHVMEQNSISFSLPPDPDAPGHIDTLQIDSDDPGWVYAKL